MARITVEDCLKRIPNRFEMVKLAAKRARQIALDGREPTIDSGDDKATVVALREIAAGTVTQDNIQEFNFDIFEIIFNNRTNNHSSYTTHSIYSNFNLHN